MSVTKTNLPNLVQAGEQVLRVLRSTGRYPHENVVESAITNDVTYNGHRVANFLSNSFLGLCDHPKIIEAGKNALDKYGAGAGSARLVSTQKIHRDLEAAIAAFKGREDAIIFSTGMLVNVGVIPALASSPLYYLLRKLDRETARDLYGSVTIFLDKLNHSCIYDGAALSMNNLWGGPPAKVVRYNHLDTDDLASKLASDDSEQKIVATDGVFSIHGHLAPLPEIVKLARQYSAIVYVDDAHGTGVLGATGRGTAEMFGVDNDVNVPVGTLSKALGVAGGFVAGSTDFCDYLRGACRTYVFQTAMPPSQAGALIEAIKIAQEETWRREAVLGNALKVRSELERLGFSTLGSNHHIVPVLIGDEIAADEIAQALKEQGVLVGCIPYPAVPMGEAILRCNMMATHTTEDLERLTSVLETEGRKRNVI